MADPVTMAIATAVAGKAAESLTDQARECLASLVRRIREKFRDRPARQAALEAAAAAGDHGVVNVFQGRADKVVQLRDVHGDLSIG